MLSRGASCVAEMAKDISTQAGSKAVEFGGAMSDKVKKKMIKNCIKKLF